MTDEATSIAKEKTSFIVLVTCKPDPSQPGAKAHTKYLASHDGYASHTSMAWNAERFDKPPSLKEINSYSGMPWYDAHDKRFKPRVFRIHESVTVEEVEL